MFFDNKVFPQTNVVSTYIKNRFFWILWNKITFLSNTIVIYSNNPIFFLRMSKLILFYIIWKLNNIFYAKQKTFKVFFAIQKKHLLRKATVIENSFDVLFQKFVEEY